MAYDAIVIGTGFGGAITARRLAEKGMRVLILERGRRWSPGTYPRTPADPWVFSHAHPETFNGWLDLRFFGRVAMALGAGVGGGSLCYSAVAEEAPAGLFDTGWPAEITAAELRPHYDTVAREMGLTVIPDGQLSRRFRLSREAAERTGNGDRFRKAGLVMSFDEGWNYDLEDAVDLKHSRAFVNAHGVRQGTCVHLGNCDIGCDAAAKNSLDFNYIPCAETAGAELRPLHVARVIEPADGGYRVVFDHLSDGRRVRGEETARRVVVAAGSVGSTELLLRCRDEHRTLPAIGPALGKRWSGNANLLSLATYSGADDLRQSTGPAISGLLDFTDGAVGGERFAVEDDGFPNLLLAAVKGALDARLHTRTGRRLLKRFEDYIRHDSVGSKLMVWLGSGADGGDGEIVLRRRWYWPFGSPELDIDYPLERSAGVYKATRAMHEALSKATGGHILPNPMWDVFGALVTLHPLGGCAMGDTAEDSVVDHLGRVHAYPGLYVIDGAMVPTPTVLNPSHTIAALAERAAAHIN